MHEKARGRREIEIGSAGRRERAREREAARERESERGGERFLGFSTVKFSAEIPVEQGQRGDDGSPAYSVLFILQQSRNFKGRGRNFPRHYERRARGLEDARFMTFTVRGGHPLFHGVRGLSALRRASPKSSSRTFERIH